MSALPSDVGSYPRAAILALVAAERVGPCSSSAELAAAVHADPSTIRRGRAYLRARGAWPTWETLDAGDVVEDLEQLGAGDVVEDLEQLVAGDDLEQLGAGDVVEQLGAGDVVEDLEQLGAVVEELGAPRVVARALRAATPAQHDGRAALHSADRAALHTQAQPCSPARDHSPTREHASPRAGVYPSHPSPISNPSPKGGAGGAGSEKVSPELRAELGELVRLALRLWPSLRSPRAVMARLLAAKRLAPSVDLAAVVRESVDDPTLGNAAIPLFAALSPVRLTARMRAAEKNRRGVADALSEARARSVETAAALAVAVPPPADLLSQIGISAGTRAARPFFRFSRPRT